jgi:hypothetical protein
MARRRQAVGDIVEDVVLLGGIGLLGYLAITSLPGLLSKVTPQGGNNSSMTDANATAVQQSLAAGAAAGQTPTITAAQAANIANQFFTLGSLANPDYYALNVILLGINNDQDFLLVEKAFGTKSVNPSDSMWTDCYWVGINCSSVDFPTFVKLVFSQDTTGDALSQANAHLLDAGISYSY